MSCYSGPVIGRGAKKEMIALRHSIQLSRLPTYIFTFCTQKHQLVFYCVIFIFPVGNRVIESGQEVLRQFVRRGGDCRNSLHKFWKQVVYLTFINCTVLFKGVVKAGVYTVYGI